MEPSSTEPRAHGRAGSLKNPEVYENVPGHVIPILEREFDDFDTEADKFLARRDARGPVHRLPPQAGRLRPAPARRADDPREAAVRRRHPRADGGLRRRRRAATRRSTRATSRPARTSRSTTSRSTDMAELIREISDGRASPRARAAATRSATSPATRWAGVCERRALRPHPLRRRLRALLRPPPDDAADAAQGQDRVHGHRRRPRDHRHPRHRLHRRASATACAGFEIRVGGGTSIMPRVAPTLYEFVERRQRRLPEGHRGRACGSSTARSGCASTAPAPGSRCWSTRSASTPSASMVDEELEGDWVDERDFTLDHLLFVDDEEAERARRRRRATASPNGDRARVRALRRRRTSPPQRQEGFSPSRSRSPAAT